MSDPNGSVSKLTVPIGWALAALPFVVGTVMWLSNLQGRLDNIEAHGSPAVQSAESRLTRLETKLESDETSLMKGR